MRKEWDVMLATSQACAKAGVAPAEERGDRPLGAHAVDPEAVEAGTADQEQNLDEDDLPASAEAASSCGSAPWEHSADVRER